MTQSVDPSQILWNQLPADATLKDASSTTILDVIKELEKQEPLQPPMEAIEWLKSSVGIMSEGDARQTLMQVVHPQRTIYIRKLHNLAQTVFEQEPTARQNKKMFDELQQRHWRMYELVTLGLYEKGVDDLISQKRQDWQKNYGGDVVVGEYNFRSDYNLATRSEFLTERLKNWKDMLDEIAKGLPKLDDENIRKVIAEDLKNEFAPSSAEIERTRQQLSTYNNEASAGYALSLLKKEDDARRKSLTDWIKDIDNLRPISKRSGP